MKTMSTRLRGRSPWLHLVCFLGICPVLGGCVGVLDRFGAVEREASKCGTVAVGAARVIDYDDRSLEHSRDRLRADVNDIRRNLRTIYGTSPQITAGSSGKKKDPSKTPAANQSTQQNGSAGPTPKGKDTQQNKPADSKPKAEKAQQEESTDSAPTTTPSPQISEVDLIASRMTALKFLESEIADIDIGKMVPVPPGFHRFEISLDCSAWVRGDACAVLVEIDLYPYMADSWCYEAAHVLKDLAPRIDGSPQSELKKLADMKKYVTGRNSCATHWNNVMQGLECFCATGPESLNIARLFDGIKPNQPVGYYVARWHKCLEENQLRPRIVHVERMSRAEYQILSESNRATSNYELGLAYSAASAKLGGETEKQISKLMATMQPVNLAFVAGEQRAGWLFMPGKTTEGRMSPTERRLKMVVDVPEKLSILGIHVHKIFLDSQLRILGDSALARQVAGYRKTRSLLDDAEQLYPDDNKGGMHYEEKCYRFVKTRMRNMLYQGWPEEIRVDIPEKNRAH